MAGIDDDRPKSLGPGAVAQFIAADGRRGAGGKKSREAQADRELGNSCHKELSAASATLENRFL
jgi:hypothetical protein